MGYFCDFWLMNFLNYQKNCINYLTFDINSLKKLTKNYHIPMRRPREPTMTAGETVWSPGATPSSKESWKGLEWGSIWSVAFSPSTSKMKIGAKCQMFEWLEIIAMITINSYYLPINFSFCLNAIGLTRLCFWRTNSTKCFVFIKP